MYPQITIEWKPVEAREGVLGAIGARHLFLNYSGITVTGPKTPKLCFIPSLRNAPIHKVCHSQETSPFSPSRSSFPLAFFGNSSSHT
jgi:hypothetical protein